MHKKGERETRAVNANTYQLPVYLEIAEAKEGGDISVLKGNEAETLAPSSFSIKHDCRIDNFTELRKKFTHRLGRYASRETTNKEFCSALVFLPRYSSLGIDLLKGSVRHI